MPAIRAPRSPGRTPPGSDRLPSGVAPCWRPSGRGRPCRSSWPNHSSAEAWEGADGSRRARAMPCAEQPKRVIVRRVQALDDKQGGNSMTLKRKLVAAAIAALGAAAAQAATTELVLYKSDHFRGPAQSIKGEVNNLENGMGHEASSMVVRGGAW